MEIVTKNYEFIVCGGGISGMCAALAAARHGVKTALIQDRPVLGGNASSEIKMHICGADSHGKVPDGRETGIIEELQLLNRQENTARSFYIQDAIFYSILKNQKNLDLFLNTRIYEIKKEKNKIVSLTAQQMTTEKNFIFSAPLFADTTGDAFIAKLAGANYFLGREAAGDFKERMAPEKADNLTMGNSIMFMAKDMGKPVKFEKPEGAYSYSEEDLKYRIHEDLGAGYWWIEYGGDELNTIYDAEEIRDELLKIIYGVWDHVKNGGNHGADNYALDWINMLPGKRESRRIKGDYVLTENDILTTRTHYDDVAYGGWPMDIHVEGGMKSLDKAPTIYHSANGLYGIPYRCLYSENIENLWVGGRAISATHIAFASTRVMGTCGVVGQAIGTAASIASKRGINPRAVLNYIEDLQQSLIKDDCYIPSVKNKDIKDVCLGMEVISGNATAKCLVDGYSRNENGENHKFIGELKEPVTINFGRQRKIKQLMFKFDSDLMTEITITIIPSLIIGQKEYPVDLIKKLHIGFFNKNELIYECDFINERKLRFCVFNLNKAVECDSIILYAEETFGAEKTKIYEVRAYEE